MKKEDLILKGYEYAKTVYAENGVDVEAAMQKADAIPVSMHCWQGDDVIGFDGSDSLTGGIQTTGNYPGRARTAEELRSDIAFVKKLIPGATKLNMHACYAEKNGKKVDRDEYTIAEFQNWVDFAKEQGLGLDFNPTYFSHPKWTAISPFQATTPTPASSGSSTANAAARSALSLQSSLTSPAPSTTGCPTVIRTSLPTPRSTAT